jgi:hypothetical protein
MRRRRRWEAWKAAMRYCPGWGLGVEERAVMAGWQSMKMSTKRTDEKMQVGIDVNDES